MIAPDTLVIAEEFSEWSGSQRRIDLLAIDRDANLVVIELKRTEDGGYMELQALRFTDSHFALLKAFQIRSSTIVCIRVQWNHSDLSGCAP